jgi:hypothetical protein
VLVFCGSGILPRFSRRSEGCFGEVGSSWLEATPTEKMSLMYDEPD